MSKQNFEPKDAASLDRRSYEQGVLDGIEMAARVVDRFDDEEGPVDAHIEAHIASSLHIRLIRLVIANRIATRIRELTSRVAR